MNAPTPPRPPDADATPPAARASWTGRAVRALLNEVENVNVRLHVADALVFLLPTLCFCRLRTAIYRLAGFRIGPRTLILGRIALTGPGRIQERLRIGASVVVNAHCYLDLTGDIEIGDHASIGHHVLFITAEHETGPALCRAGPGVPKAIRVAEGAWVAAGATILPGVSIGASSVVAAGSLVSGSVPAHRVVGGVPARPLRSLPELP